MKKLLFLLFISFVAKAQTIQGTLINSETKEPIPYATIKNGELKKVYFQNRTENLFLMKI